MRDKKAFFNEQCKKVKENNRMGKTRDLFKKIGDTTGTFHAEMGNKKGQKQQELKQKRLRRGDRNTQKNYTGKVLVTWITMMV